MQFMTVRQARQRIVPREMPDVLLGPAPRCDILDDDHRVAVGHAVARQFELAAVGEHDVERRGFVAGQPEFALRGENGAAGIGRVVRAERRDDGGQRRIEHDFARRAEQLRGAPVRDDHAALAVDHAQAVRHVSERGVEARDEFGVALARGDQRDEHAIVTLDDRAHRGEIDRERRQQQPRARPVGQQRTDADRQHAERDLHHREPRQRRIARRDSAEHAARDHHRQRAEPTSTACTQPITPRPSTKHATSDTGA